MWRPEPVRGSPLRSRYLCHSALGRLTGFAWRAPRVLLVLLGVAWMGGLVVDLVLSDPVAAAERSENTQASTGLPPGDGAAILRNRCLACHGPQLIAQQRLSEDGWSRELDKMTGWGATVAPDERETLVRYLGLHFGASRESSVAADAAPLLKLRCSACHDLTLIAQQRLDEEGWSRELDKMIGWGAALTEAEKSQLAASLARRSHER